MTRDILIKVPVVDQWRDTKNKKWADKVCAICSLKMVLDFKGKLSKDVKVMNLVREGLALGGFIENIGWKHKSIVEISKKHRLKLDFQKKFFKTRSEKLKGIFKINRNIKAGKPAIISIHHKLDPKRGGHLVVINGVRLSSNKVIGYHIQDPDHKFMGNNYFISKRKFLKGWRGGMIYLVD